MGKPCVILLEIDSTGKLVDPAPGRAEPGSHVAFAVTNSHATDTFDVIVDLANTVLKSDKTTKKNPFGKAHRNKQVKPDEIDVIQQKIRPATDFGSTGLPYTTYKYTVIVKNLTTGATPVIVDPDIDVPPA